jgi:hypothetical protein
MGSCKRNQDSYTSVTKNCIGDTERDLALHNTLPQP